MINDIKDRSKNIKAITDFTIFPFYSQKRIGINF